MSPCLRSAHKRWLERSVHEGVLVVAGRSMRDSGLTVLVQGLGRAELEARLRMCPLAGASGTRVEIQEISTFMNEACLQILEGTEGSDWERLPGGVARRDWSLFE